MGSLLALCLVLVYLATTRQDRVDPDGLASHSSVADSGIRARLPFTDGYRDRTQQPIGNPISVTSVSNGVDSTTLKTSAVLPNEPLAPAAIVTASPDDNALRPEPLAKIAGKSELDLPSGAAGNASVNPAPMDELLAVGRAGVGDGRLASDGMNIPAASPRRRARAATAASSTNKSGPAGVSESARALSSGPMLNKQCLRRRSGNPSWLSVTVQTSNSLRLPNVRYCGRPSQRCR